MTPEYAPRGGMYAIPDHDPDLYATVVSVVRDALADASQTEPVVLASESVDAIARRVIELRHVGSASPTDWVDAATLASHLGVTRGFVYEHADELGARRLGDGPKARLRFSIAIAEQSSCFVDRWSEVPANRVAKAKTRSPRRSAIGVVPDLLPIRGRSVPLPVRDAA